MSTSNKRQDEDEMFILSKLQGLCIDPSKEGIFDTSAQRNRRESNEKLLEFHDFKPSGSSRGQRASLEGIENQLNVPSPAEFHRNMLVRILPVNNQFRQYSPLEALHYNPDHNLELSDVANYVMEFANDQTGARFIQAKIVNAAPYEKRMIFPELNENFYELTTHMYGNFIIQKIFKYGLPEQRFIFADHLKEHMKELSLHTYGCRVVQRAIQCVITDQRIDLVKELDGSVLECINNRHGTYVIQKCFEQIDSNLLQFIVDAVNGHLYELSLHPYGCRVIQKIIKHCTATQIAPLIFELRLHVDKMITHAYANFVISCVLEFGKTIDKSFIIKKVIGKILTLSQNQHASHVVENCFKFGTLTERQMMVDEVCRFNSSGIVTLMKDQYGNYVAQVMLEYADPIQQGRLKRKMDPHKECVRRFNFGSRMITSLDAIETASTSKASSSEKKASKKNVN